MFVLPVNNKAKQIVVMVDKNQLTCFALLQGGEFYTVF